jgi:hypothetical protein
MVEETNDAETRRMLCAIIKLYAANADYRFLQTETQRV